MSRVALAEVLASPIRAQARCAPSTDLGEDGERSETGGGIKKQAAVSTVA